jgi:predicted metal-dependent phosphoesterase TrpH
MAKIEKFKTSILKYYIMEHKVVHKKPDFKQLKKSGFTLTDMHFHTCHSDTYTKVDQAIKKAGKLGVNLAITDHNIISGVEEAYSQFSEVNVIPGVEVSCAEGHHILVYFSELSHLQDFYYMYVEPFLNKDPFTTTNLKTIDLLKATKKYDCLSIAAHPVSIGACGIMRNVWNGSVSKELLKELNGFEVISGENPKPYNKLSKKVALSLGTSFTGGSDGHILAELGNVVTVTKANSIKGILDEIRRKENFVIGKEGKFIQRLISASRISSKHVKYLPSFVDIRAKRMKLRKNI